MRFLQPEGLVSWLWPNAARVTKMEIHEAVCEKKHRKSIKKTVETLGFNEWYWRFVQKLKKSAALVK